MTTCKQCNQPLDKRTKGALCRKHYQESFGPTGYRVRVLPDQLRAARRKVQMLEREAERRGIVVD